MGASVCVPINDVDLSKGQMRGSERENIAPTETYVKRTIEREKISHL
jgi:hypothetical protein